MSSVQLKRVDKLLSQLAKIHGTISHNPEIEFDIEHLLPVVETSINALAEEIDSEMEEG